MSDACTPGASTWSLANASQMDPHAAAPPPTAIASKTVGVTLRAARVAPRAATVVAVTEHPPRLAPAGPATPRRPDVALAPRVAPLHQARRGPRINAWPPRHAPPHRP